jgi:hypothetical protein
MSDIRIVDMPDLGAVTDTSSFVGEHSGSGRFAATALQNYLLSASRFIFVRKYGAVGNGTTDDTAAINAAFAAVPATGGVVVFDPGLTYATTSHLSLLASNTVIQGNGAAIVTSHLTDDLIQVGSAGATLSQLVVKDLRLWASVVKTGGACVRSMGILENSDFENVQFGSLELWTSAGGNRLWNGLDLTQGFYRVLVDGASEAVVANHGVRGAGAQAAAAELQLNHRTIYAAVAVYIGGSANVYMNGEISACGTGVYINKAVTGAANREIFFQEGSIIDSCADYGLHVAADSVSIIDAHGCWFTSAGRGPPGAGVGVYIEQNAGATNYCTALFNGVRLYNNTASGLNNSGAILLMTGCLVSSNGAGIILNGLGGVAGSSIYSNLFYVNSGVALQLSGTGLSGYAIETNNFVSNGTAISGVSSWGIGASVRNNVGFPTSASGTAAVPAGTNPTLVVTHHLPGTPASITLGDTNATYPVSAISANATTFTIILTGTTPGPIAVYWRADMGTNS